MKRLPKYRTSIMQGLLIWGAFLVSKVFYVLTSLFEKRAWDRDPLLRKGVGNRFLEQYRMVITSCVLAGGMVITLFAPASVSATTIYQQILDSSGSASGGAYTLVGSFVSPTGELISGGRVFARAINTTAGSLSLAQGIQFRVSTTTDLVGAWTIAASDICQDFPTIAAHDFVNCQGTISGQNGVTNWEIGQTYYVWQAASLNGNSVITGARNDRFFGFITTASGNEIPLGVGLSGITNEGLSTSTVQVYCDNGFATSSGFYDTISKGIATGFCNVGVFLFIPSVSAVAQWQTLASTTESKIPFSYFFDIYGIFTGLTASTSGSGGNFQAVSIDFSSVDPTASTSMGRILPTHFEALSTTTIRTYIPDSVYNTMFLLMRSAIWVVVGLTLYRKVVPVKAKI